MQLRQRVQNIRDGAWDYDSEVAFPFGYGLSYTTFAYSNFSVKSVGDHYEVSVTVKNTGAVKGKEVVQVYLQKPYTQYDIDNQVEKIGDRTCRIRKDEDIGSRRRRDCHRVR